MAGRMLSGCIQLRRATWMINSSVKKFSTSTPSSKEILKDLPEHIVPLKLGLCQVYLVGVNHMSQESVADVQRIVRVVKPNLVFLELCENCGGLLMLKEIPTTKKMVANIMENWKDQNIHQLFASLTSRQHKVIPGSEFRIAYEEAIKYGGRVLLGDRPIE
ncbi:hypothetical protein PIB30_028772, partial [Stylosanthes scabra]|nr:hypothetical protein [Stylosanthes scabra]